MSIIIYQLSIIVVKYQMLIIKIYFCHFCQFWQSSFLTIIITIFFHIYIINQISVIWPKVFDFPCIIIHFVWMLKNINIYLVFKKKFFFVWKKVVQTRLMMMHGGCDNNGDGDDDRKCIFFWHYIRLCILRYFNKIRSYHKN